MILRHLQSGLVTHLFNILGTEIFTKDSVKLVFFVSKLLLKVQQYKQATRRNRLMNKSKAWLNIRDSFWFMPTIYIIAALFAVILTGLGDVWLVSGLKNDLLKQLLTSKDTAKKLYATLVTAILTMTTLSFSVIMVVLTTYASQYSPRVLQNFMKNRLTQPIMGIYSSGFIFALVSLFLVDGGKPIIGPFVMVVVAIINLGAFIYFIHHSARFLQVNNLIGMLKSEGTKLINHRELKEKSYKQYITWDKSVLKQLQEGRKTVLTAERSGYLQYVRWSHMVDWAAKNNFVIILHVRVGSIIPEGLPVMTIWTDKEVTDGIRLFLIIGHERSDIQDIEFTIEKIVEIALRAISPAINDPHTAINCINRLGVLLAELGDSYQSTPYLTDTRDQLRVVHNPNTFEDYLYKSFYQLRDYGKDDVSVIYGIMDTLYKIAVVSCTVIQQEIWEFHYYIMDVVKWNSLSELDQEHLQEVYDRLEACCGEH